MDNSFNGCQKLKNIDLTRFEHKQNVSLVNMFKNCASLNYVDLSSFHSYNFGGIFYGCLNIVMVGGDEKCKSCSSKQPEFCGSCNEGYYLSEYDKTKCKKCSLINCKICPNDICTECFNKYKINYEANYPYLTDQEAFDKVYKEMNLHDTPINKIYYKTSDSKTIAITIPKKIYFVWNKYQREMIAIYGITLSTDSDLRSINNEYIQ